MTSTPEISAQAAQLLVDQLVMVAPPLFASGAPVIAVAVCCGQLSVGRPAPGTGQAPPCRGCLRPFSCSYVLSQEALMPVRHECLRASLMNVTRAADE